MRKSSFTPYHIAIRGIPILCAIGFLTILIGGASGRSWTMRAGTFLFLSGFALWGFANGGGFLWALVHTIQKRGFKVFRECPWSSSFFVLFMLFFFYAGCRFVCMMARVGWN